MKISYAPKGVVQIDDARIIWRNFEGRAEKYNREGNRNFALVIPTEEQANELINDGWNVQTKEPREEGDYPLMYLKVKVKFNDRGPGVYLTSGRAKNRLSEETVGLLDKIDIMYVNLDIRPYDWEINGKTGRTAYLQSIEVVQEVDRFAEAYAEEEYPEE